MATKILLNLPVKDLKKSIAFFTRLGFTFNPHWGGLHMDPGAIKQG
jgi:predicted lactoylglutathione lyase